MRFINACTPIAFQETRVYRRNRGFGSGNRCEFVETGGIPDRENPRTDRRGRMQGVEQGVAGNPVDLQAVDRLGYAGWSGLLWLSEVGNLLQCGECDGAGKPRIHAG